MMKKLFLSFVFFLFLASPAFAVFPTGWSLIGHVDLPAPASTLTDFPVVIAGIPANSLEVLEADFKDFRPTLAIDGTSQCHFEIPDRTNRTTANAEIWIKIPSYTTTGNGYNGTYTRVFIWGKNPSATYPAVDDATWGSDGVWDSATLLNYHMNDTTTSTVTDSTANNEDGIKAGANAPPQAAGKIGYAQNFGSTTQYISPDSLSSSAGTYTFSMWVKSSTADSTYKYLLDVQTGRLWLGWYGLTSAKLGINYGATSRVFGDTPDDGNWHYLVFTFDGANSEAKCFVDGTQSGSTAAYTSTNIGGTIKIGKVYSSTTGYNYVGVLDEFMVSATERSADWLNTSYACQNSPGTYGTWTSYLYKVDFITHDNDGSLSGSTTQYIPDGEDCTAVTATPDAGYEMFWSGSYGTANPLTVTNVTADITVTAYFNVSAITALGSSGFTQLGYVDLPAPDANLRNFPVVLSDLSDDILAGLQQTFGDLRVTSDSSGTLPCAFEIPTRGSKDECNREIWVRVQDYTTSGNGYNGIYTRLFFWGNNSTATYPSSSDAVWGSQRVWGNNVFTSHMGDLTTSTVYDSTTNAHNGAKASANNPIESTGKIGRSQLISSDYIDISSSTSTTGNYTISMWVYKNAAASTLKYLFDSQTGRIAFAWNTATSGKVGYYNNPAWVYFGNAPVSSAEWHYFVLVLDAAAGTAKCYLDNVQLGTDQAYVATNIGGTTVIGSGYGKASGYFDGVVDEFSISPAAQSAAWIDTAYTNQANPATYGTYTASFTPSRKTWYVGNSGGTYGAETGTSGDNAWPGWASVDWNCIYSGDTIIDFSNERYSVEDKWFSLGDPLIIDGGQSVIDGAATINNADWTNVSGNVYRAYIRADDCAYMQPTAPANPTEGEKWYINKNIYTGSTMGPVGGSALEWKNGEWQPCDFFYDIHMGWVDGVKTYPVITEGPVASQSNFNGTSLSNTVYGGHVDNYWVGASITIQTAAYRWEASRITSSTGNQVTFGNTSYSSLIANPQGGSYIIGIPGQLTTEGEWCYDALTGYFYCYSTAPATHVWQYSDYGVGILIRNSSGITVQNYTIRNTNDSAIIVYKSPNTSVLRNSINTIWPATHLICSGAISVWGDSPYDNFVDRTEISGINVSHNTISKTYNGQGIYLNACNGDFNHNSILETGDVNWFNGSSSAINGENASGNFNYNYVYYSLYSGIFLIYPTDTTISYNFIKHSMNTYRDGGCLYLADNLDGNPGGNILEYNRIEYWGPQDDVSGIYLDNYASYNTVRNNVFYNGPAGAAPSIAVLQPNVHFGVEYNALSDNTAYTLSGTMIGAFGWPDENVGNTTSNNVFANPADYPYLSSGSSGAAMLLMMMR
ncbi:MAG: LamG-like jellyroll fold domain-containing protein [Smithella sp.]